MLVLSRKIGQQVCIGATVVVTVVEVHNGQVRLAIDAPPGVCIDRDEVRQRKVQQRSKHSVPEDQEDPVIVS
jgi:carbon storage regulator CsrA